MFWLAVIDDGSISQTILNKKWCEDRLTGSLWVSKQTLSTLVSLVAQNRLFVYEICFFLYQITLFQKPQNTFNINWSKEELRMTS